MEEAGEGRLGGINCNYFQTISDNTAGKSVQPNFEYPDSGNQNPLLSKVQTGTLGFTETIVLKGFQTFQDRSVVQQHWIFPIAPLSRIYKLCNASISVLRSS